MLEYRSNHNMQMKQRNGDPTTKYFLPEKNFRYGRANRPPTPINYVLSNFI